MSFIAQIQSFEMDMPIPNYLGSIIFKFIPQEAFPVIMQVEPLVMKYYPLVVLFVILVCIFNVVRARFFGRIIVSYPGGETVSIP